MGFQSTTLFFKCRLRTAFSESTVITIAHRIKTIIDSDQIIVLGDGLVLESGAPETLLADPLSAFSSIAAELGETAAGNVGE